MATNARQVSVLLDASADAKLSMPKAVMRLFSRLRKNEKGMQKMTSIALEISECIVVEQCAAQQLKAVVVNVAGGKPARKMSTIASKSIWSHKLERADGRVARKQ